jgi:hypothetical protein
MGDFNISEMQQTGGNHISNVTQNGSGNVFGAASKLNLNLIKNSNYEKNNFKYGDIDDSMTALQRNPNTDLSKLVIGNEYERNNS